MPKIRMLSDLHLEFGPLTLAPAGEDVLVLAGDIGIYTQGMEWAIEQSDKLAVPVVMIAGNHEFYRVGTQRHHTMPSTYAALRALAAASKGRVTFLENEAAVVAGVRFLGATLWTDFDLDGTRIGSMFAAERGMNDYRMIHNAPRGRRFAPAIAAGRHAESRAFIESAVIKQSQEPIVVMTHMAPSRKSIAPGYRDSTLNPAYASHLDALVSASGAKLWVHGHVHTSFDYRIGETRVLCNPRGYFGDDLNENFNPDLVIEV